MERSKTAMFLVKIIKEDKPESLENVVKAINNVFNSIKEKKNIIDSRTYESLIQKNLQVIEDIKELLKEKDMHKCAQMFDSLIKSIENKQKTITQNLAERHDISHGMKAL